MCYDQCLYVRAPVHRVVTAADGSASVHVGRDAEFELSVLGKGGSRSTFITRVLLCFRAAKVAPRSGMVPPGVTTGRRTDQIVRIIQNVRGSAGMELGGVRRLLLSLIKRIGAPKSGPSRCVRVSRMRRLLRHSGRLRRRTERGQRGTKGLRASLRVTQRRGKAPTIKYGARGVLRVIRHVSRIGGVPAFGSAICRVSHGALSV